MLEGFAIRWPMSWSVARFLAQLSCIVCIYFDRVFLKERGKQYVHGPPFRKTPCWNRIVYQILLIYFHKDHDTSFFSHSSH